MRVGIGQLCSSGSHAANLEACTRLCALAVLGGAKLLCLPEAFAFIGSAADETVSQAEPLAGPRFQAYQALARDHGLWLSLGGYHEVAEEAEGGQPVKVFNTHALLDASGSIVAEYRKVHLFDVSIPGGAVLMESRTTVGGDRCVVADTPFGVLGLSTCYDLRFPELYRELAERGAQVLLAPSAFTVPTGRAHWHLLLRARAVETQCYMLAAAQVGEHNERRRSYGHALAVDPWGTVLADAGGLDEGVGVEDIASDGARPGETVVFCDIDLDELTRVRERMPLAEHRKQRLWRGDS